MKYYFWQKNQNGLWCLSAFFCFLNFANVFAFVQFHSVEIHVPKCRTGRPMACQWRSFSTLFCPRTVLIARSPSVLILWFRRPPWCCPSIASSVCLWVGWCLASISTIVARFCWGSFFSCYHTISTESPRWTPECSWLVVQLWCPRFAVCLSLLHLWLGLGRLCENPIVR